MNVTPHDDNCRISTYYNVYHNGELVSTNYNVENITPCIFKAGEEYIIKFFGIHKNCDNTDLNYMSPQIKVLKVADEPKHQKLNLPPNRQTKKLLLKYRMLKLPLKHRISKLLLKYQMLKLLVQIFLL